MVAAANCTNRVILAWRIILHGFTRAEPSRLETVFARPRASRHPSKARPRTQPVEATPMPLKRGARKLPTLPPCCQAPGRLRPKQSSAAQSLPRVPDLRAPQHKIHRRPAPPTSSARGPASPACPVGPSLTTRQFRRQLRSWYSIFCQPAQKNQWGEYATAAR